MVRGEMHKQETFTWRGPAQLSETSLQKLLSEHWRRENCPILGLSWCPHKWLCNSLGLALEIHKSPPRSSAAGRTLQDITSLLLLVWPCNKLLFHFLSFNHCLCSCSPWRTWCWCVYSSAGRCQCVTSTGVFSTCFWKPPEKNVARCP